MMDSKTSKVLHTHHFVLVSLFGHGLCCEMAYWVQRMDCTIASWHINWFALSQATAMTTVMPLYHRAVG